MRQARTARLLATLAFGWLSLTSVFAAVTVTDDSGRTVSLPQTARRIVSLSPHATEMLFAAGAGARVVGVVEHSDYPPQASQLPSLGSGLAIDMERLLQLKPDLVVAWSSGNSAAQIRKMREFGIPVFESEPRDFPAIATSMERLAVLAGTETEGRKAAAAFRAQLERIEASYRKRQKISVFYQIWRTPLMTLNGKHPVSIALDLCGAKNIFSALPQLAPTVDVESVLKANPDAIIASSGEQDDVLAGWRRFPALKAVAKGNLVLIDGSLMNRSGPRILDGTETLCRQIEAVRGKQ